MDSITDTDVFETDVPARLDRLPWARFHWLVVIALGITWILDGLEVTLVGSLAGAISASPRLHLTEACSSALTASSYLAGAVVGALGFGWLTDRLGRKKLFTVTVLIYLVATVASGLSWNFWSFAIFRFITGARHRRRIRGGQRDHPGAHPRPQARLHRPLHQRHLLARRGARRVGAVVVLDKDVIDPELGWRLAFVIGGVIGARRAVPAPLDPGKPALADDARRPRGRQQGRQARSRTGSSTRPAQPLPPVPGERLRLRRHKGDWFVTSLRRAVPRIPAADHPRRRADGGAGVLLQCGAVHLCADADQVLRYSRRAWSAGSCCRSRSATSAGRCCWASCSTCSGARPMIYGHLRASPAC